MIFFAGCAGCAGAANQARFPGRKGAVSFYLVSDLPGGDARAWKQKGTGETVYLREPPLLDGRDVASASVEKNDLGSYQVFVTFTKEGSGRLADVTSRYLRRRLGIVVNGELLSTPVIMERIMGGRAVISFSSSDAEAGEIAGRINRVLMGR